tara:strand:- start:1078 stop:1404 length:327 start_codon:yes stop_codon:yes gene_type:complete
MSNLHHGNKQAIQEVLLTDMQRRIFKQYNDYKNDGNTILTDEDYDTQQTLLVDKVLHCNNMRDVNELLTEYCDLFTSYDDLNVPTIDGTLNYVVGLLVKHAELTKCKC